MFECCFQFHAATCCFIENHFTNLIAVHEHVVKVPVIRPVDTDLIEVVFCHQIGMSTFHSSR